MVPESSVVWDTLLIMPSSGDLLRMHLWQQGLLVPGWWGRTRVRKRAVSVGGQCSSPAGRVGDPRQRAVPVVRCSGSPRPS